MNTEIFRDLSEDDIYEVLNNQRRRHILDVLGENTDISMKKLSEKIVSLEKNKPTNTVTDTERENLYISLQHHLEKMDRLNAIEYNKKTNKIESINCDILNIYKKINQLL